MHFNDEWSLTPARVAIHLPTGTAVIADLHLDYAKARHTGGEAVPARDLEEILQPLASVLVDPGVRRLIIAGDLFERRSCRHTVRALLSFLAGLNVELTAFVPGNHDRALDGEADELPIHSEGVKLGRWHVVHGHGRLPAAPVVHGHDHPCLRWPTERGTACYLVGRDHLILPAFSDDASGVNVVGVARWARLHCYVIAGKDVLDLGEVGTLKSKLQHARPTAPVQGAPVPRPAGGS